jgi:hypothetical protein
MTTPHSLPAASAVPAIAPPDTEPVRVPLRDAPQAPPLDPSVLPALLNSIIAREDEMTWASIPWQTDLWEARRIANEQGKPIFAWMMNGNPLGCV